MNSFNLDSIYIMPSIGTQRDFNLDIPEMNLAAARAESEAVKQRLIFDSNMLNCLYLRRRLHLLEVHKERLG